MDSICRISPYSPFRSVDFPGRAHQGTFKQEDSSIRFRSGNGERFVAIRDKASPKIRIGHGLKLKRIGKTNDRAKCGHIYCKQADAVDQEKTVGLAENGVKQHFWEESKIKTPSPPPKESAADEVDATQSSGSSAWARIVAPRGPLTSEEEHSLSADVQDMLNLESQREELEKELGRTPSVEEWAEYSATSVFKLYARVGKGRAAKRKMISSNLPLVNSLAVQFRGKGLSHWELCQEGVGGLMRSAEKYDTSHKTKFSTYSFLWIWERMSSGVKKFQHALRVSRGVYKTASFLLQRKDEFQVMHGREPTLQELADSSHVDKDEIRNVMRMVRPVRSMDDSNDRFESGFKKKQFEDQRSFAPWKDMMESELKSEVAQALQILTPREQLVLEMRFGLSGELPLGRSQVAESLNLTYEAIRQTEKRGLERLRRTVKEDELRQYLSSSLWA